ncbi:MAG: NCS2 family permease [Firmicutes bacterium]|nr:NCS2 family permease [Bacillota bacterium]
MLEKLFKLSENKTDVRTEIVAGLTTFMTMAYIIFVNPSIVSATGMPFNAVLMATCFSAALATLFMALLANYPFALAPGMGLNAYFTYSVVLGMGVSWQTALGAVFISGIVFLILTVSKIREMIIDAIPSPLKLAISAGIGLFIAFIGLQNAGIIVDNPATLVGLGDLSQPTPLLAVIGVVITAVMLARGVNGAILLGIIVTTIVGFFFGVTKVPEGFIAFPHFEDWAPVFGKLDIGGALSLGLFNIIFAFLFVDMFDTIGTLVGVSEKGGFLKDGKLPRASKALLADSLGTVAGSIFGTPTVTTYVESASGVAAGGRTGLTGLTVSVMFLLALFFSPLIGIVPAAATAPALIIVGSMMITSIVKINWQDFSDAIPAFLGIITMPLSYSIATGIAVAFALYPFIKLFAGKGKEVNWLVWVLSILFIIRFAWLGA